MGKIFFLKNHSENKERRLIPDFFFFLKEALEGVHVTNGNPASCLFFYLTFVHFGGKLQYGGDFSQQKIKRRPIKTREIGGVSLSDVLYVI